MYRPLAKRSGSWSWYVTQDRVCRASCQNIHLLLFWTARGSATLVQYCLHLYKQPSCVQHSGYIHAKPNIRCLSNAATGWQRQLPCRLPATRPQAAADPQKPPNPSPLQTCTTPAQESLMTMTSLVQAPHLLAAPTSCHLFQACLLLPAKLQHLPVLLHSQVLLPHNPRSLALQALKQQV